MPTLEWIGKDKVVNHHLEVPYRVLEHQYTYLGGGETGAEDPDGNKIIRGDNLEALKSLLPQYEGRVKCIYIDIILQSLIQFNYSFDILPLAG